MTELQKQLRRSLNQLLGSLFSGPGDRSQYAEPCCLEITGLSHPGIQIVRQADEPDAGGAGDGHADRRPQELRPKRGSKRDGDRNIGEARDRANVVHLRIVARAALEKLGQLREDFGREQ